MGENAQRVSHSSGHARTGGYDKVKVGEIVININIMERLLNVKI